MICNRCQEAGDNNAEGYENIARGIHEWCAGGTQCFCQHRVGKWITNGHDQS